MNMEIKVDAARAMAGAVGKEHGITPEELRGLEGGILENHALIQEDRRQGKYGFFDLYKDTAALTKVREGAAHFQSFGYENLVVLGIGGSALGITALNTALNPPYYNLLTKRGRKGRPRLLVMDNIDPVTFRAMLRLCPPKKTLYNVISKSGETAETISQLMIVVEQLEKKLGKDNLKNHLAVTTSPRIEGAPKSLLHPVADEYDLMSFDIPLNVGGRFSVFTPVGMFPAAILGMELEEMMSGCAAMDERCSRASLMENPAYLRAAIQHYLCVNKGKVMSVMMPYSDGLRDVADWYRQLWAESLGKRFSLGGEEIYAGQTPIKALGATDQHSQVQLYREGPNDKIFNLLEVARFDTTLKIPDTLPQVSGLGYLRGKSMNKLMAAELRGTADALKVSKRPVIRIVLPRINANTVAQLLYMLEVETAMAGRLFNVNPFDQPGVEEGKQIARRLMGGEG